MKNYYELLEVSEKASPEVIKKAYTTLVKKYHPDLQPDGEKKAAEEKIKEINEAYEVLSDESKRQNYDNKLKMQRAAAEKVKEKVNNTNQNNQKTEETYRAQKKIIHEPHLYNNNDLDAFNQFQEDYTNMMNEAYNNAYNQAYNNAYNQAYINNLKNMGYEIHYEKTFKEKIKIAFFIFVSILVVIAVGFILSLIPPVKNYFVDLYNNNEIIKIVIDIFSNIIKSFISLLNRK